MRGTVTSPKRHRDGFGLRLTIARESVGMTQQQLAQAVGLSQRSVIGYYECGKAFPSLPVFARLCDVLGVTMDDMWTGENRKEF
jgi:transcriptional regulator with XRE-family HTH domain